MHRTAGHEQREDGLFRVFSMLVVMVLLTIRAGLEAQATAPMTEVSSELGRPMDREMSSRVSSADVHRAAIALLRAVEFAARRLKAMMRNGFELMNDADVLALRSRAPTGLAPRQCRQRMKCFDSS